MCHHPDKFVGHKHCGSGEIMVLVCHVILQDPMTIALRKIMGKSPAG